MACCHRYKRIPFTSTSIVPATGAQTWPSSSEGSHVLCRKDLSGRPFILVLLQGLSVPSLLLVALMGVDTHASAFAATTNPYPLRFKIFVFFLARSPTMWCWWWATAWRRAQGRSTGLWRTPGATLGVKTATSGSGEALMKLPLSPWLCRSPSSPEPPPVQDTDGRSTTKQRKTLGLLMEIPQKCRD